MDVPGHDPDLDFIGCDDAGTIGTEQQSLLALHAIARANHVAHWNAFGDADDEVEVGIDGLVDRRGRERRRNVDNTHRRARGLFRFLDGRVDRNPLEILAGLFRIYAGDEAIAAVRV